MYVQSSREFRGKKEHRKKLDCLYKRLLHLYLPSFLHIFPVYLALIKNAGRKGLPFLLAGVYFPSFIDKNIHKFSATENRHEDYGLVEDLL